MGFFCGGRRRAKKFRDGLDLANLFERKNNFAGLAIFVSLSLSRVSIHVSPLFPLWRVPSEREKPKTSLSGPPPKEKKKKEPKRSWVEKKRMSLLSEKRRRSERGEILLGKSKPKGEGLLHFRSLFGNWYASAVLLYSQH